LGESRSVLQLPEQIDHLDLGRLAIGGLVEEVVEAGVLLEHSPGGGLVLQVNAFARSNRFATLKDAIRIIAAAPSAVPTEAKPLAPLPQVKPVDPSSHPHVDLSPLPRDSDRMRPALLGGGLPVKRQRPLRGAKE
jgi:hypothetical protein